MTAKSDTKAMVRSKPDELFDKFEKMPPEERRRDIERAEVFLRANGIDSLRQLDKWMYR